MAMAMVIAVAAVEWISPTRKEAERDGQSGQLVRHGRETWLGAGTAEEGLQSTRKKETKRKTNNNKRRETRKMHCKARERIGIEVTRREACTHTGRGGVAKKDRG
ncbi:uncharacterized protein K489DRAFT_3322 [Dissoconium aciculare CBS 342.82]|uniref:Uncharacterized protein n=1 Tax=Dissoconium aciculare CBS 342.82 TaxID=1314786 RepID=A0A6J3MG93_9PEZI|nr:uncharacterized protein K489DRAFT_3322 [Dissoconium aciculare CBS 342.82]KAF1826991.1 hypothetical protein K489DRAFT_3322 [Dissoconium aciculare CBS 342.82]